MDGAAEQRVDAFLERWVGSQGNERANYQSFLQDWCGALGVAAVLPKGGEDDSYCFDKDVVFFHKDKAATTNFIDCGDRCRLCLRRSRGVMEVRRRVRRSEERRGI